MKISGELKRIVTSGSLLLLAGVIWGQTVVGPRTEYIRMSGNVVATVSEGEFTDIVGTVYEPFAGAAELMFSRGITNGCVAVPRQYCPSWPLLRDEMAVFVIRAWSIRKYGTPEGFMSYEPPNGNPYFADVPPGQRFFWYIQKLWETGISNGCAAGVPPAKPSFCPSSEVLVGQSAAFTIRARNGIEKQCPSNGSDPSCALTIGYSYSSNPYFYDVGPADVPWFQFAQLAVQFGAVSPSAVIQSLPSPCALGAYCNAQTISRGQMAPFVTRIILNQPD